MKRFAIIIILIVLVALCGCAMPLKPVEIPQNTNNKQQYTVYVSGAVANDGYTTVDSGSDYYALLVKAGLLDCAAMIDYSSNLVNGCISQIIINYIQNGRVFYSVNVNGASIIYRLNVENVSEKIVNKIADYIELNGSISNRTKLRAALGEDYEDNYYKFFIDEQDYA